MTARHDPDASHEPDQPEAKEDVYWSARALAALAAGVPTVVWDEAAWQLESGADENAQADPRHASLLGPVHWSGRRRDPRACGCATITTPRAASCPPTLGRPHGPPAWCVVRRCPGYFKSDHIKADAEDGRIDAPPATTRGRQ